MPETDPVNTVKPSGGGSRLLSGKGRLLLVGLVLALSLGYLLYTAFPGSIRYYMTVSEFVEDETRLAGRSIRIAGKLDPGSLVRAPGTLDHTFNLVEGGQQIRADYTGVLPDLFDNAHTEIVLEGAYQGGVFHTDSMVIRCPSKYRALVNEEV